MGWPPSFALARKGDHPVPCPVPCPAPYPAPYPSPHPVPCPAPYPAPQNLSVCFSDRCAHVCNINPCAWTVATTSGYTCRRRVPFTAAIARRKEEIRAETTCLHKCLYMCLYTGLCTCLYTLQPKEETSAEEINALLQRTLDQATPCDGKA